MNTNITTRYVDFLENKNPLLKDTKYDILMDECYDGTNLSSHPGHLEGQLECGVEVVLPRDGNEINHLYEWRKHMFEKHGLISDMCDCYSPTYHNADTIKLVEKDCNPFSAKHKKLTLINSFETGLKLINIKLEAIRRGILKMTNGEAINLAFCFPKYGELKTTMMCYRLFKGIQEDISDQAIEAFLDVLLSHFEFHSDLDLTQEFEDSIKELQVR
jgi:hypothetical protein